MSELRRRTKSFAIEILRFSSTIPRTDEGYVIRRQLIKAGTSPGAHCREATRSRSDAEMISKIETALQELDESMYWMELLLESDMVVPERLQPLMQEADELIAMGVTAVRTIKRRRT